jgi:hypothetical protein
MQFRMGAVHAMVLFIDCMNSSQISLLAANRFNFNIGNNIIGARASIQKEHDQHCQNQWQLPGELKRLV